MIEYEEYSMRKILFHLNCFEQGGAERVVSNLANWLVQEDYEVLAATQWQGGCAESTWA